MSTYLPPVDQLLTLGAPKIEVWDDYRRLGIGPEHVPELLRMMLDMDLHLGDGETDVVWAPMHAWRAVAQWKAPQGAEVYLQMLAQLSAAKDYYGDWEYDDANAFFLEMGPESITPLADFLDERRHDEHARWIIAEVLAALALRYPETRGQVVAILARQLERPESQPVTNGGVVAALLDMQATEAVGLLEAAFRDGKVDESICGDWAHVGYELGVLPKPPERARPRFVPAILSLGSADTRSDRAKSKAKAKRKLARASRKRNRRR